VTAYPGLANISIPLLIENAGGDPWAIDQALQDGEPGEIAALSRAFFNAGVCTSETVEEFDRAQARFAAAWNHQSGDHPINDSAEVQRASDGLMFQQDQLPKIAATLARIAASLAAAQTSSCRWTGSLDARLRQLDLAIGRACLRRRDTAALEETAIRETVVTLAMVEGIRDVYASDLHSALTNLQASSRYDPLIDDVDGDGVAGPVQRGLNAVEDYAAHQRSSDRALADSDGPMTGEKADAAARLRDFDVATDPDAEADARQLAGERLDDFQMAGFTGPLPVDPIFGGDARTRARSRLDIQRQLERGAFGLTPMEPDQATRELDEGEHFARSLAVEQAVQTLQRHGMTEAGAKRVIGDLSTGSVVAGVLGNVTGFTGPTAPATATYAKTATRTGRQAILSLSSADLQALKTFAGRVGLSGNVIDIVRCGKAASDGAPVGRTFGETAGSIGGGALAVEVLNAALAGSMIGPEGAAAAALAVSIAGSYAGKAAGGRIGSGFDQ